MPCKSRVIAVAKSGFLSLNCINKVIIKPDKGQAMIQREIGNKIAELRKQKGLTQEELAYRAQLNVRSVQRIESGEVTPRFSTLKLLSRSF